MKISILIICLLFLFSEYSFSQSISYDRQDWLHWEDFDKDCQNTRQELLILYSESQVSFTNDNACTVRTGKWFDLYTGKTFTLASDVDIDHIIPLKYANDHGGAEWTTLTKKLFANDSENLLIVEDNANQSKGARGPSGYLPRLEYQCEYAFKWIYLANKYNLYLDISDQLFISEILNIC